MIDRKVIGSVLLIGSMAIGAGMLALPVALAKTGFFPSMILLLCSWIYMTFTAFLLLEANLRLPRYSNVISMVRSTLGRPMEMVAWTLYLFLLYVLLSAYISGGSDLINHFFSVLHLEPPRWLDACLFVLVLSGVVAGGIHVVDHSNRVLVLIKISLYVVLVGILTPHVTINYWTDMEPLAAFPAIPVLVTAFGFSIIVPTLRTYLQDDVQKLRIAIFSGSLLPLIFFTVWIAIIFGTIPRNGDQGLISILGSPHEVTLLAVRLRQSLENNVIANLFSAFSTVSLLTAFLGVSLSLTDFLADGFGLEKKGYGLTGILLLAFVPPIIVVALNPALFVLGLRYAGILVILLMGVFPGLMVWRARYQLQQGGYCVLGGKVALALSLVVSIGVLGQSCYYILAG